MRRVLLVSYYIPPRVGIGTTRMRQLMAHLPSYGWEVTAVTARLEGAGPEIVQTPYFDIRGSIKRTLGLEGSVTHEALGTKLPAHDAKRTVRQRLIETAFHVTNYPDAQAGWYFGGRKTLRSLIESGNYDIILSSAPPFTANLMIASALQAAAPSKRIPWISDFRDLWTGNVLYGTSPLRHFFDNRFERQSLRLATGLTTVSQPMADELQKRYPHLPVHVIPNAFDPAEWQAIPFDTADRCTFLYAGELLSGRRDPRPLFRAARALLDSGKIQSTEFVFEFYSEPEPWLFAAIAANKLGNVVRVRGKVDRQSVLRAERQADRLVVILWDGAGSEGILTGKIFEYLGARRRIIIVGGPPVSAVDAVLEKSQAGSRYNNDASLEQEILDAVIEHRNGQVPIIPLENLEDFEASTLAHRFSDVLDSALTVRSRG